MKSKVFVPILAILLGTVVAVGVSAQSNERLDELLNQDPATSGHAAYLVLTAAGLVDESVSPEEAFRAARQQGFFPADATADGPITFGRYSYLLMETFGVPGGVMYRIFPGPRYAAREVVYKGWSRTRRSPGQEVTGDAVARILSVYLNTRAQQGGAR